MPTGYTAKLASGEQSISEFIEHIGRGMGFMIMMRDEPSDAPLPDCFEPSDYHARRLVELQERKAHLNSLAGEGLRDAWEAQYAEQEADDQKYKEGRAAQLQRYEDMLAQVREWAPTHHAMKGTKAFAIEQLTKSIDFDCSYQREEVARLSPEDWQREECEQVAKSIEYHTAEHAKEESRAAERNEVLAVFKSELAKLEAGR